MCFIGTYPPRQCGIATFTADLCQALLQVDADVQASVIALTHTPMISNHPPEVVFEIRQHQLTDYRQAAEYINLSGVHLVCVQHEYGIFGGPAGRYIIELLDRLRKPVVTTLHTVWRRSSPPLGQGATVARPSSSVSCAALPSGSVAVTLAAGNRGSTAEDS